MSHDEMVAVVLDLLRPGQQPDGHRGDQANKLNGYGQTFGSIAKVNLGNGDVVLEAIQGKATVKLVDGELERSIRGTTLGSLTIDGQPQQSPRPGEIIRIAGVGTLTFAKRVNPKARNSVHVIAVQIKLLGGDTVINLGEAKAAYRRF